MDGLSGTLTSLTQLHVPELSLSIFTQLVSEHPIGQRAAGTIMSQKQPEPRARVASHSPQLVFTKSGNYHLNGRSPTVWL